MLKVKPIRIVLVSLILIAISSACLTLCFVKDSQAGLFSNATVKLYSNGQVVGTWVAVDIGKVQGNSLVFTLNNDKDKEIRICGTYSIETNK